MAVVFGFVRTEETSEPVDGLVVSVLARGGVASARTLAAGSADPFRLFTRGVASAITDAQGRFRIELDLQGDVNEQSELMLAVLAPPAAGHVVGGSASRSAELLLYWTELPPLSRGQSEAFVIRLAGQQLQKHRLTTRRQRRQSNPSELASLIVRAETDGDASRAMLRDKLAARRRERAKHRKDVAEEARSFAADLRATSKAARGERSFVSNKGEIENAAKSAVAEGVARITAPLGTAAATLTMTLDDGDLARAGVTVESRDALVRGERIPLPSDQMCQLVNERRGGTELVRVRGLLDALQKAGTGAAGDVVGPASVPGPGVTLPDSGETMSAQDAIAQKVLGQLRDMPAPDGVASGLPRRQTAQELRGLLQDVRLGAGPTDVLSFHDLHHLEIAFPHVWTEAFDPDLREDVRKLYDNTVRLHEDYLLGEAAADGETPFPLATELQEMDDLKDFLEHLTDFIDTMVEEIPTQVAAQFPGLTWSVWRILTSADRAALTDLATRLLGMEVDKSATPYGPERTRIQNDMEGLWGLGVSIYEGAQARGSSASRLVRLLDQVRMRLEEPYAFHYFAPGTVNFGLLLTYRQYWQPGTYQVGDMVATIPLAPGEKRRFESKQVVKRTRAETELRKALTSKNQELTTTRRADAEIMEKASLTSNFKMTSEGTFRFGIGEITAGTEFSADQAQESSRVKKDFREAVLKAAQEYRQEHSVEVRTTDDVTTETTTSGEISNPNNEITVTYLLYELERQYSISERIHRVTPVIMVAMDVPAPNEITESWLLTYEWILRRVLLDDSFRPALDYLGNAFAGEEVSITVRKATWEKQVALITELEATVKKLKSSRDAMREMLVSTEESRARAQAEEPDTGQKIWAAILTGGLSLLGGDGPAEEQAEQLEVTRRAIESRLQYLEGTLGEAQERFVGAEEALNEATNAYSKALESQTNRRVAIDQLRIHIKDNILYYMQAIWEHTPPDQRFFSLYHLDVDLPESPSRVYHVRLATPEELAIGMPTVEQNGRRYVVEFDPPAPPSPDRPNRKKLVEIADLDHPLGYKGNYIIFPLKTCLYLTNFMMREFFDDYFGVSDPDLAANYTVEELVAYSAELVREGNLTDEQRAALQTIVMTKLRQPRRDSDLVVVPTGELYMEALPGTYPLLEDFKLQHRVVDMAKAKAEWRQAEIENLRRAARLLQAQPDLQDPDIDRHVVVDGSGIDVHVDTP